VRNVLERILSGVESAKFYLNFMAKNAKTDFSILQNVKVCSSCLLEDLKTEADLIRTRWKTDILSTIPPSHSPKLSHVAVPPVTPSFETI
jgi:hypothetical protein